MRSGRFRPGLPISLTLLLLLQLAAAVPTPEWNREASTGPTAIKTSVLSAERTVDVPPRARPLPNGRAGVLDCKDKARPILWGVCDDPLQPLLKAVYGKYREASDLGVVGLQYSRHEQISGLLHHACAFKRPTSINSSVS